MTDETNFQSKYDLMRKSAQDVKNLISLEKAKSIIKEFGHAELLNQVKPEHQQAVIDACERALNDGGETNELDDPTPVAEGQVNVFYACCRGMQDAAIQGLSNMPEDATVEQAINAIYNAWVHGGFVSHYN